MKIARIISTKSVVINAGSKQGIHKGDILSIMDTSGLPIKDPDTQKVIGNLEAIKANVIATAVYDNMTIAEAPKKKGNSNLKDTLMPSYWRSFANNPIKKIAKSMTTENSSVQEELNVDPTEIEGLPISDKPIKIGDRVEKRE